MRSTPSSMRWACVLLAVGLTSARALEITPYSAVTNNLFVSWGPEGFHQNPVLNTNAGFVGAGYDWTGVGWSSTVYAHNSALITPRHLATAAHYSMESTGVVVFVGADGQTVEVKANPNYYTAHDDSAIQPLMATVPSSAKVTIYSALDVGNQTNFTRMSALVYGHGGSSGTTNSPRIAPVLLSTVSPGNGAYGWSSAPPYTSVYATGGDSASPTFVPWTNPVTGEQTLTILGTRWSPTADSFLLADMGITNVWNYLASTGYALRWVANPDQWWTGGAGSGDFGSAGNWNSNAPVAGNTVVFDAATASGQLGISLGGARMLNGVYFKATGASGDGFTITNGTLGLTKVGMINYDDDAQTIRATMVFNAPQTWDGKAGGFVVGGVMTNNGYILVLDGTGTNVLRDAKVLGTGALTKEGGGFLAVEGTNTLGGHLWVHDGTMVVRGGMFTVTNANIFSGTNATVYVNSDTGGKLVVSNGTFAMRDMNVGNEAGFGGLYQVAGGSNTHWGNLSVGRAAGALGEVLVTGGELDGQAGTRLYVGESGQGLMVISGGVVRPVLSYVGYNAGATGRVEVSGGSLQASQYLFLGENAGAVGTLTVNGGSFASTNGYYLSVGGSGVGSVTQSNGLLTAGEVRMGRGAGAQAYWRQDGGTSTLTQMSVGYADGTTGAVTVAGGRMEYTTLYDGRSAGATGTVVVSAGELVGLASSQLRIGEYGQGLLVVSGGMVRPLATYVGGNAGGQGRLEVQGGQFLSGSYLYVGDAASALGTLAVNAGAVYVTNSGFYFSLGGSGTGVVSQTGGLIQVTEARVGRNAGALGTWNVNGGTSSVATARLGYASGTTGIVAMGGGRFEYTTMNVGYASGATGAVVVTGGELVGLASSQLRIGESGSGSLVVSGGMVRPLNTYVGAGSGARGRVQMEGGAFVEDTYLYLGEAANTVGTLAVNAGVVLVTNSGYYLSLGGSGAGNVVQGGGLIKAGEVRMGRGIGAQASWQQDGGTSQLTQLSVGYAGGSTGSVAITGGQMEYTTMYVGRGGSGVGSAVVGGGTLMGLSGSSLYVGENGQGTLRVTNGLLNPAYTMAGYYSGMVGRIQLDGGTLVADSMDLGYYTNALGVLAVNGGSFTLTNSGKLLSLGVTGGRGELWQSNGLLSVGDVRMGRAAVSSGFWAMDGGTSLAANVFLGYAGASTGSVVMTGGRLVVTNTAKTALFQVGRDGVGSLVLSGGVLQVDRLVATNGSGGSTVSFAGGTLVSGSSLFGAGSAFQVGGLGSNATLNLAGGTHQFGGGLLLGSNATLAGTGGVVGSVTNFGTVAPGNSPGAITNYGSLTLMDSSVLSFELGGTSRGVTYDTLVVTNVASMAGLLSVKFWGGFETNVQVTDTFTLLSAANLTGFFNNIASGGRLTTSDGYGSFLTTYDSGTDMVVLSNFQAIPEPSVVYLVVAALLLVKVFGWTARNSSQSGRDTVSTR